MTQSSTGKTILLVEDDLFLRDAFKLLLEDAGYRVLEASNAREAEDSVAAQTPSLVLLDLGLPDKHGLEVVRAWRASDATRDLRVVALTGRVGPAERRECMEAGCTSYLAKPIEPRELLRRLPEMLE